MMSFGRKRRWLFQAEMHSRAGHQSLSTAPVREGRVPQAGGYSPGTLRQPPSRVSAGSRAPARPRAKRKWPWCSSPEPQGLAVAVRRGRLSKVRHFSVVSQDLDFQRRFPLKSLVQHGPFPGHDRGVPVCSAHRLSFGGRRPVLPRLPRASRALIGLGRGAPVRFRAGPRVRCCRSPRPPPTLLLCACAQGGVPG